MLTVAHFIHYPNSGIVTMVKNQVGLSRNRNIKYIILSLIKDFKLEEYCKYKNINCISLNFNKLNYFEVLNKYTEIINTYSPNVVHTHSFLPRLIHTCYMKSDGIKHVTTIHNDYPYFYSNNIKSILKRIIDRYVIHHHNIFVICCADKVFSIVKKIFAINDNYINIIYNGIPMEDINITSERYSNKYIKVITVGRLSYQKNIPFLLESWCEVVKKRGNVKLIVLGDGEEKENLIKLTKYLGIEDKVSYMGWIDGVKEYLDDSDIFVLSSLHEGFPTVAIEASSRGLPLVSTKVSGVEKIIFDNENGYIVENKLQMTKCLIKLIDDKNLREVFGRKSLDISKKYNIYRYIDEVESLYVNNIANNNAEQVSFCKE